MKSFFKTIFAVLIGIIIFNVICFVLIMAILGAATAAGTVKTTLPKSGILKIDLSKINITERTNNNLSLKSIIRRNNETTIGIWDAVQAINKAANDDRIKYIYLLPDMSNINISLSEELRQALSNFRKSGKPVIAFTERPTTKSYYLASVADKVLMCDNIGASPMITGIGGRLIFLKDILDKLQVNVQLIRHGKYKSAGEMFVKSKPSDENLEQNKDMIKSLWNSISSDICSSRNIPYGSLSNIIDSLQLCSPKDMLNKKLADKLVNIDTLNKVLAIYASIKNPNDLNIISFNNYIENEDPNETNLKKQIAVIYADGAIVDGNDKDKVAGDRFVSTIQKIEADSSIKAVVLRVASPGGSVLASDKIKSALDQLKKVKPIIASYGYAAASGGYWISNNSDKIFSDKTTITGSIGVFSIIPDFSKTAKDLLKVNVVEIGSSVHSNMYGGMKPLDAAEINYLQKSVNDIYEHFVSNVAKGRDLTTSYVDSIAQGRVWTGEEGLKLRLVDQIGTLEDAINYAIISTGEKTANVNDWSIVDYPKQKSQFEEIMDELTNTGSTAKILENTPFKGIYDNLKDYNKYSKTKVYASLPYKLELY